MQVFQHAMFEHIEWCGRQAQARWVYILSEEANVTSLKREPAGHVRTLYEFFALAHAMESDAVRRYTESAEHLRKQGETHLAELFERLAEVEGGHVGQIEGWAARRGESKAVASNAPFPLPDTFDAPPDEMAQSKLLTPYRALASAVRHEERSFAFWTYVAAHAARAEVKQAAERMAHEELEHVSLLRRERREAYHAEDAKSGSIEMSADVLADEERRLSVLIKQDAGLFQTDRETLETVVLAADDAASKLDTLEQADPLRISAPALPAKLRDDPSAVSERLVEAYLKLADSSKDAAVVKLAQELAGAAIYRLAVLKSQSEAKLDSK
jgi:rubrerythrin